MELTDWRHKIDTHALCGLKDNLSREQDVDENECDDDMTYNIYDVSAFSLNTKKVKM